MSTGEYNPEVSLHIQRVKAHLQVRTDEELAQKLGMSKQNIANWRRRGAIPEKIRMRFFKELGVFQPAFEENFDSLQEASVVHAAVFFGSQRWLNALGRDLEEKEQLLLGEALSTAIDTLRWRVRQLPRPLDEQELLQKLIAESGPGSAYGTIARAMAEGSVRSPDFMPLIEP